MAYKCESLLAQTNKSLLSHRREVRSAQYALKLRSIPQNPAYLADFQSKYKPVLYENKPNAIPSFSIIISSCLESHKINLSTTE